MNDDTFTLPQSFSMAEVCDAFGCTDEQILRLIKDGKVGYIVGKRRTKRFATDHVTQIRECLEVKPAALDADVFSRIGVTPRSAARRRRA